MNSINLVVKRNIAVRAANRPGMTLVEIMIVLTIMASVMAFAAYSVVGYMNNARIRTAESEVARIGQFVEMYYVQHGQLPSALADLERQVGGFSPITDHVPDDPWGNSYSYQRRTGGDFTVFSLGPDGQSGTADDIYPAGRGSNRR